MIALHHGHNGWPSMPELLSFSHLIHSAGFDVQRHINNDNNNDNHHDSYNNSDNEDYSDYNGNDSSYDVSFNSGTLTE